jgi:hypothetical protein
VTGLGHGSTNYSEGEFYQEGDGEVCTIVDRPILSVDGTFSTVGTGYRPLDTVAVGGTLAWLLPVASLWLSAGGQVESVKFGTDQFGGRYSDFAVGSERAYGFHVA